MALEELDSAATSRLLPILQWYLKCLILWWPRVLRREPSCVPKWFIFTCEISHLLGFSFSDRRWQEPFRLFMLLHLYEIIKSPIYAHACQLSAGTLLPHLPLSNRHRGLCNHCYWWSCEHPPFWLTWTTTTIVLAFRKIVILIRALKAFCWWYLVLLQVHAVGQIECTNTKIVHNNIFPSLGVGNLCGKLNHLPNLGCHLGESL